MALIPDTLGPLMLDLLDCALGALIDADAEPGRAYLVPGLEAVWDDCCEDSGTLYVRVIETYPSVGSAPFPGRDIGLRTCHPNAWAVQLAVGVVRCTPTQDDNGVAPTVESLTASALEMTQDRAALETAIRCCFANNAASPIDTDLRVLINGWVPLGAQGGCAGGEWTLYVALPSCACPEEAAGRATDLV